MRIQNLSDYRPVQAVAKTVLAQISSFLDSRDTERSIAARAASMLAAHGLTETWYYACPALVLLGTRSSLSLSGREYTPSDEPVGDFNLVTIDLSPCRNNIWGDCSRSFCIEEGRVVVTPKDSELKGGMTIIEGLHNFLRTCAKPTTTFDELCRAMTQRINMAGFENLDYLGNIGHSIEQQLCDRDFIERGNERQLGEIGLFTFEPHVRKISGRWGFKHENVYYFSEDGTLEEL